MAIGTDELYRALAAYRSRSQVDEQHYAPAADTQIQLVQSSEQLEPLLDELLGEDCSFLGLDTEWAEHQQVALLQVSAGTCCLLVRPCCLRPAPPRLVAALRDERVLKVGVGLGQDLRLLETQFGLETRGAVELSALAARYGHVEFGVGLAGICRSVLGRVLPKDQAIRCSNWDESLSEEQIYYAACDATVAADIAWRMHEFHAEPAQGPQEFCGEFVDRLKLPKLKAPRTPGEAPEMTLHALRKTEDKVRTRSTLLYDSCLQLGPDGDALAYVPRKKAEWYVQKGLAILISEDPFEFQLLFEPKAKSNSSADLRQNLCVCCGKDEIEDLVRFNVVPHGIRSLLVSEVEARSFHDILLLCKTCFVVTSAAVSRRRERLFREHDIDPAGRSRYIVDDKLKKGVQAAGLLLKGSLPVAVLETKLACVRAALGRDESAELSRADLDAASRLETRCLDETWCSPESQLVAKLQLSAGAGYEDRCQAFVVAWREEFVRVAKPRHLPVGWSVHHISAER